MEIRLLSDPVYVEEFDVVVNELTDQYVAGAVQGAERDQMERYFFAAPARREKLRIAAALKERQQAVAKPWLPSWELRVAASILIVAGLALGIWWALKSGESEFDKGMAALQTGYSERRPIEPRISTLSYLPFPLTRGSAVNDQRQEDFRRAELHFAQAVREKPTPETHHALGKAYLAQGKFDDAIREFEQALSGSQTPAQVYNDLGVAWLEKIDFNRSLDSLNKALELDGNLLDALFNRALCYEKQSRFDDAKAAWNEYLKHDSTSNWAYEARQHLIRLNTTLIY
ncbi:MAG TPA: tetratricopeptide repeat protein [Pyrinomonadaceae bacterium]|nr:tetratricopeptide repeat protein [Pyrinomonadaceae bacterium]